MKENSRHPPQQKKSAHRSLKISMLTQGTHACPVVPVQGCHQRERKRRERSSPASYRLLPGLPGPAQPLGCPGGARSSPVQPGQRPLDPCQLGLHCNPNPL